MISIKKNDFEAFFNLPFKIYAESFPHVSYLKSDLKRFLSLENPLFTSVEDFRYFTAEQDGKLVGRILAHIHHASNKHYNTKRGYFGYFDCINDQTVANALLKKAEDFLRSRGMDEIAGNFNLTAMQQIGVVKKIHSPYHYTDQVFSPEYIAQLLANAGYSEFFPMVTHEVDTTLVAPESLISDKAKKIMDDPEYSFDELKKENLEEIIEAMRICLNGGFTDNPMFVPLTRDEIHFQAKDMMLILDRDISVIARHKGKPIGAIVCIPNLNPLLKAMKSKLGLAAPFHFLKYKMTRDSAVIIYYSVLKEYHSLGINAIMLSKMISALKRKGYKRFGGTWISTDNKASIRQAEKLGAKVMHDLVLYKKDLV
jgi:GNAT superfamily N-acetyltransferase